MAEIYRQPDEKATPEEVKLAEQLAAQHEALAKLIERRAFELKLRHRKRLKPHNPVHIARTPITRWPFV